MDSPGQLPWPTSPQKIFTQKTKIPIFFKLKGFSHSFERMDYLANLPVTPKKKQISSQKIYYTFLYYIIYYIIFQTTTKTFHTSLKETVA